ncbi:MAG: T9SS type A sorting domain-containing protein [Bacteroidetes bacterium]|nr:T9SS type A sorting domain-containing protein [Bacteroidota bacterium]MBT6687928.1 T9SS type A sorting domain-containing protein [Bacteroidota bacterium]MBT7143267.1 T9SS type A sorting domain-containing protein [Bacteroidota bacterium]MBT7490248.1 T9SS type A sorting domain-containing protein [Bacteroidota bacterium]
MKKIHLLLVFAVAILGGIIYLASSNINVSPHYIPRIDSKIHKSKNIKAAMEWLNLRKAGNKEGIVDLAKVREAEQKVKAMRLQKGTSSINLNWVEMGPDNIGGRTRALLIDKDDPNKMIAGGVAGGIWISTTAGQSWSKYNDLAENLSVASICQAANGDIYVGTGEGAFAGYYGNTTATNGMRGQGIWKSTDRGLSFNRLPSTYVENIAEDTALVNAAFSTVSELAADPTDANKIYASTTRGLLVSYDAGDSWSNPIFISETSQINVSDLSKDVAVASDGTVIAAVGNKGYISADGSSRSFTKISGNTDSLLLPNSGISRMEFAFAPSDPNFIYCLAAQPGGTLENIYQSTDKGISWNVVGQGGYAEFQPLGDQGEYDAVIAVYPDDKNSVLVGGQGNVYKGTSQEGTDEFYWEAKTEWYFETSSLLYVHADQHAIEFHPNYNGTDNKIVYISSDGGVHRSDYAGEYWQTMNKNYNTVQFYAVGISGDGRVIGGTQDNGTQYIDFLGNTDQNSVEVTGGDGGYAEISELDPDISFSTLYFGDLFRSAFRTEGYGSFYSSNLSGKHNIGTSDGGPRGGCFVTPIALWESFYDEYSNDYVSYINDTIFFSTFQDWDEFYAELMANHPDATIDTTISYSQQNVLTLSCAVTFPADDMLTTESLTNDLPLDFTLSEQLLPSDTIWVKDTYQSLFAVGLNGNGSNGGDGGKLWVTRQALNFAALPAPAWYQVLPENYNGSAFGEIQDIVISKDGNYIYFSTDNNRVYRVSGLLYAREAAEYNNDSSDVIKTSLLKSFNTTVTSISIDPNDAKNIVVTIGGYGEGVHIYYSSNATQSPANNVSFSEKQGNLPFMPVYSAILNWKDGAQVMIGTEFGVYSTEDITADEPVWVDQNPNGFANVPVFMLRQQIQENRWKPLINNHGYIYAATHGRGFFRAENMAGPTAIKEIDDYSTIAVSEITVFPNPVSDLATVKFYLNERSEISINVYNLNGQIVKSEIINNQTKGNHNYSFDVEDLKSGTYVLILTTENQKYSTKFIVNK